MMTLSEMIRPAAGRIRSALYLGALAVRSKCANGMELAKSATNIRSESADERCIHTREMGAGLSNLTCPSFPFTRRGEGGGNIGRMGWYRNNNEEQKYL